MSSTLFNAPHPLVPLAKFHIGAGQTAALEGHCGSPASSDSELALAPPQEMRPYSLFPPEEPPGLGCDAPDFLGRLHHLKTLFRMSATQDPVSVMIHRIGPLLILDDGPCGWSRGGSDRSQPLPPLSDNSGGPGVSCQPVEADSHLMLAALDPTLEMALVGPQLAQAPAAEHPCAGALPSSAGAAPEMSQRLCVKNTFLDFVEPDEDNIVRTQSAPARMSAPLSELPSPAVSEVEGAADSGLLLTKALARLQPRAEQEASTWSLMPYQPEAGEGSSLRTLRDLAKGGAVNSSRQWDVLSQRLSSSVRGSATMEALRSVYSGIPPQPSRFGRSVEWRCGQFKILLGCDLVVLRSGDQCDPTDFASFRMLPPGGAPEPSREERLDVYLENLMCDITKAVWGSNQQGSTAWRIFKTQDLPTAPTPGDGCGFDPKQLQDQGEQLLHFLRQQCHQEGGTYWLFREQSGSSAELFDLSGMTDPAADESGPWKSTSRAFRTTPSLAAPIASLCLRLAKAAQNTAKQRQLLQKGLHLIEPIREEHPSLYAMIALQLACSYMRTPLAAIPDKDSGTGPAQGLPVAEPPPAARLALSLRNLEGIIQLLTSSVEATRDEVSILAELLLQANVGYAECIVKLVREACIPTYTAWLAEVQRRASPDPAKAGAQRGSPTKEDMRHMKRLSAAFLLWRLFWLCRAQRALAFMAPEKREIECWTLDRDLCEIMGDTLYGLSRYPADDADDLLAGQMATADGICRMVEDGLRVWGLRGVEAAQPASAGRGDPGQQPVPRHKRNKSLTSPASSPACSPRCEEPPGSAPHNVSAIFLARLDPLARGTGDDALREDPLVRDDLRQSLWTQGRAFRQSLTLYERATARLRRQPADEEASKRQNSEEQATLKVARKLAHLYNEEARMALLQAGSGIGDAEELLAQAHRWMVLSGDQTNAARVLLNLSELHARRAERAEVDSDGQSAPFSEARYELWLKAVECCEEAASLSDGAVGRREGAFAHLRIGVHLSVHVPSQARLAGGRREETLAELADRHFGKALCAFDTLRDEREIAVCHFHMADLALQELRAPGGSLSKARLTSALRHARRSAAYWERAGALQYVKDYVAAHVRLAKLLEHQQRHNALIEVLEHLSEAEARLMELAAASKSGPAESELFILQGNRPVAVAAFRREMSRVCQAGLRQGEDTERLKIIYRRVLRNEPLNTGSCT